MGACDRSTPSEQFTLGQGGGQTGSASSTMMSCSDELADSLTECTGRGGGLVLPWAPWPPLPRPQRLKSKLREGVCTADTMSSLDRCELTHDQYKGVLDGQLTVTQANIKEGTVLIAVPDTVHKPAERSNPEFYTTPPASAADLPAALTLTQATKLLDVECRSGEVRARPLSPSPSLFLSVFAFMRAAVLACVGLWLISLLPRRVAV